MPDMPPILKPGKYRTHGHNRQATRQYATNSSKWRKIRRTQLAKEPLCRDCKSRGLTVAGNTVDHIDGNPWNNSTDNLQTLCVSCHSRKTVQQDGGLGY